MSNRNELCWCGSGKKWKKCHYPEVSGLEKSQKTKSLPQRSEIIIKTAEQIAGIRNASRLAGDILVAVARAAKAGVTTLELDALARRLHKEAGALPAPLGYGKPPFPAAICTSLNEVICHGIPDGRPLQEGDILNIDVTSILNGYYGDCSCMVTIGKISPQKQLVVDVAYECLEKAIAILKPGTKLYMIGDVIEECAQQRSCSVVNHFVAHGVGVKFHEPPQIFHSKNRDQTELVAGMTFTIEPMINAGRREAVIDTKDHWTARTIDGKPSGQWEHTILITEQGHEVLTNWTLERLHQS